MTLCHRSILPVLILTAFAPVCLAARIDVPLTLDHRFLEQLLREQVFSGPGASARFNDDGSGCQYLELSEPEVGAEAGRIRLRVQAEVRAGRALGDRCLTMLDWRGGIELTQEPEVGGDGRSVLLRTTGWRALRLDGSTDSVSTTVGSWIEQFLPVDLRQTRISFVEPIGQLDDFLTSVLEPDAADGAATMLQDITIERVSAADDRVTVSLSAELPAAVPVQPPPAEAELTADELAQLEQRLDALDAFFTYVVKSIGRGQEVPDSTGLLEVLVELRHDLVAILSEPRRRSVDPTRALFVDAWEGLTPIVQAVAEQQPDYAGALRYLTFIGAGDALRALDDLGPAVGLEISSDGLRRLARMLVQDPTADPLQQDDSVDAELRRVLGFGEPLPPPRHYDDTTWLSWLVPSAVAAGSLDPSVVKRLNNWVPRTRDMDEYLPMVRDVLRHVVNQQLLTGALEPAFHDVFRWLTFAAAWQESCWRQFTAEDDLRVPVQSASGDLGMMQINPTVWRGLYDLHGLRWDIVYNARAGADILEHYLIDYAIRHNEHRQPGATDNLARSAYAAYNGGPSQYDRYRSADASVHGQKVDGLFYAKYREVKGGKELAVTACYAG